jgi:hypothetical protein
MKRRLKRMLLLAIAGAVATQVKQRFEQRSQRTHGQTAV